MPRRRACFTQEEMPTEIECIIMEVAARAPRFLFNTSAVNKGLGFLYFWMLPRFCV